MALDQRLKDNLKANTEFYKTNKDKPVTPEWGFPSTLDQVEAELKKTDISDDDKKILLDWMDAFSQIKIENDTTAEARREKIKVDMAKLRGHMPQVTPTAGAPSNNKNPDQVRSEVESALTEITENDFNSLKSGIEKALSLVSAYEKIFPQYREGVRGAFGLMLLERLGKAGYAVTLEGNRVTVSHPKPENQSRATQIETFLRGQPDMAENIGLGMIYRTSEIGNYSDIYLTADKKSIKPETPRNYLDYLKDAQTKNGRLQTANDIALGKSGSVINNILNNPAKVKGIILGTPFLADALTQIQQNPALQGAVGQITGTPPVAPVGVPAAGTPLAPGTTPAPAGTPGNGATPRQTSGPLALPDWKEKPVARLFGEIGLTASQGLSDLMTQPHMLGGVLIGAIAAWIFGDWKKGLGVIAGAIGLSGIYERMKANGFDPNKAAQSVSNAGNSVAQSAAAATAAVTAAATGSGATNTPAAAPASTPALFSYQVDLRKMVEASSISQDIDKLATLTGSKHTGKLDDYLKFIETDLKDIPLSKLFPSNHKQSIFFENFDSALPSKSELSSKMLKRVLREYLTGKSNLSGAGDKLGEKEKEEFLKQHNITAADIGNKKLSDILRSVHTARVGGAPAPQSSPAPQTTAPAAQSAAPAPSPAATPASAPVVAPAATTKHKIGSVDIDVGKNIQTNIMTIAFDANGKEYINAQSKLPKDKNGKLHIPQDGVVKLGANVVKINGVDHLEVEYSGEKVYVWINHLKP